MRAVLPALLLPLFVLGCASSEKETARPSKVSGKPTVTDGGETRGLGEGVEVSLHPETPEFKKWLQFKLADKMTAHPLGDSDRKKEREVKCDKEGRFEFDNVEPGTYYVVTLWFWKGREGEELGGIAWGRVTVVEGKDAEVEVISQPWREK